MTPLPHRLPLEVLEIVALNSVQGSVGETAAYIKVFCLPQSWTALLLTPVLRLTELMLPLSVVPMFLGDLARVVMAQFSPRVLL